MDNGKFKNHRLWFGTEINPDDPRSQSEQVGDDAMKAKIKTTERINFFTDVCLSVNMNIFQY